MKKQLLTILMLITSFNCAFAYKKSSLDIVVEGQTRNMVVFTPDKTKKKMPLMIVTHGMNQILSTKWRMIRCMRWSIRPSSY